MRSTYLDPLKVIALSSLGHLLFQNGMQRRMTFPMYWIFLRKSNEILTHLFDWKTFRSAYSNIDIV